MHTDKNNLSDLDYLSRLGYEKVNTTEHDLHELRSKIKGRVFSYNTGASFAFISMVTGMFIGISVFFAFYHSPQNINHPSSLPTAHSTSPSIPYINLDTLPFVSENFVKHSAKSLHSVQTDSVISKAAGNDTIVDLAMHSYNSIPEIINEEQIKYIPNAPVIYLHDLKVTDYSSLYFKQNKFIPMKINQGLDASIANKNEINKNDNIFNSQENYYLHQAIADAMGYFSKKEYNRCLATLQTITELNPNDINYYFYSGMCYYYKQDYVTASKNLDYCITNANNTFYNEARFYKAMCLYQSGNLNEARILFKEIAGEKSFYSEKAKQFIN